MCCASSIAEFARRLPSAGSLYTYGSRGLGRTGGFLTGWMMVFAYVLYVPAGISLTSAYTSQLLASALHVAVSARALFVIIVGAVVVVAYLGIKVSSSVDLVLVAGEVAVIAALAITILVSVGSAKYSAAVLSPASSPNGQFTDITNAMIYGITAFAVLRLPPRSGRRRETRAAPSQRARSASSSLRGIFSTCSSFTRKCSAWGGRAFPASSGRLIRSVISPAGTGRRSAVGPSSLWWCSPACRFRHRHVQRGHPGTVRDGTRAGASGGARPVVPPPHPDHLDCVRRRVRAHAGVAVDLPLRRRAHIWLHRWSRRPRRRTGLPGGEHRSHPRVPGRVPRRVQPVASPPTAPATAAVLFSFPRGGSFIRAPTNLRTCCISPRSAGCASGSSSLSSSWPAAPQASRRSAGYSCQRMGNQNRRSNQPVLHC